METVDHVIFGNPNDPVVCITNYDLGRTDDPMESVVYVTNKSNRDYDRRRYWSYVANNYVGFRDIRLPA